TVKHLDLRWQIHRVHCGADILHDASEVPPRELRVDRDDPRLVDPVDRQGSAPFRKLGYLREGHDAKGRADGDVAHVFEAPAVRFTEADDDVDLLSAAAVDGRRLAAHRGAHRRRHLVYRTAEPSGSLAVDPNLELGTALVDRGLDL